MLQVCELQLLRIPRLDRWSRDPQLPCLHADGGDLMVSQDFVIGYLRANHVATAGDMARSLQPRSWELHQVRSEIYTKCRKLEKGGEITGRNVNGVIEWRLV